MRNWEKLVDEFLSRCETRGIGEKTIRIRETELLSLNLDDWNREESALRIMAHKTGLERVVPVPAITWRWRGAVITAFLITY